MAALPQGIYGGLPQKRMLLIKSFMEQTHQESVITGLNWMLFKYIQFEYFTECLVSLKMKSRSSLGLANLA